MRVIYKPRGAGKTVEIIKECAEHGGYIVCMDTRRAQCVHRMARELGFDISLPITFDEFIRGRYFGRGVPRFYIDDIDLCLQSITAVPISAISLTDENGG